MRTPSNEGLTATQSSPPARGRGSRGGKNISKGSVRTPSPSRKREGSFPERTCVITRRAAPKDSLIRLALSPDGEIAPDIRARAPGRGAYVGVGRSALEAALGKGKLKGALARAFKQEVRIPADLADRIAAALRQHALDRLGLEARGGTLITGADRIEQAARAGKVHLLIHAADAGADGNRALDQALRVGARVGGSPEPQGLVFPEPRTILSMALGRENVVHIALTDPAAARRVRHAIDRWLTFIDPEAGLEGGAAARADASAREDEGQE